MSMIGKTLSHYEISSKIGAGGMGEVYRAKDQKLGREVAIKVLPEEFARDTDRVARFEREAKLLASLNHPNIAAIYGLEESDGIHFLVLELIEGDTLAERIKSGPIPIEESLKLALQISEALEAAHEKGVIHRDLKPANIKITPEGKIKVLDFGLAKAYAGDPADLNLSNSPTLSDAATQAGVILGTAAYMPPEQAKGKSVDKRADIWAFGVVVFEMLTGRQLFVGETVSETLAAVLMKDVDFGGLPPNLHPKIKEMLERCLQKDPKNRYGSIGDARFDLERVLGGPGGGVVQAEGAGVAADGSRMKSKQMLVWAVVTVMLLIVLGIVVWNLRTPESHQVRSNEYVLPEDQQLKLDENGYPHIAVSSDGSKFVCSTTRGLFLRSVDQLHYSPISGSDNEAYGMFFSPDNQWIGYYSPADQKLKKIAVGGGSPELLCDIQEIFTGAQWRSDHTIIFSLIPGGIMKIPDKGGTPEPLFETDAAEDFRYPSAPQILPDEEHVLFVNYSDAVATSGQIIIQSLTSGKRHTFFPGAVGARWLPSGHILYKLRLQGPASANWYAAPFDLDKLEIAGESVLLPDKMIGWSVSDTGTLAYVPQITTSSQSDGGTKYTSDLSQGVTLWWVKSNGEDVQIQIPGPPKIYRFPNISPDGNKIALTVEEGENQDILIYDLLRGDLRRLTSNEFRDNNSIWTSDGNRIVYCSQAHQEMMSMGGNTGIFTMNARGGDPEYIISLQNQMLSPYALTEDGKTLIVSETDSGFENFYIGIVSMEDDHRYTPLLNKSYASHAQLSPHDDWLAYTSDEEKQENVYVRPFPNVNKAIHPISIDGGNCPRWSFDGSELFYLKGGMIADTVMSVEVETEPIFKVGKPKVVFHGDYLGYWSAFSLPYDVHADGRFLMMRGAPTTEAEPSRADLRKIIVKTNWFEELKEKVPVP